MHSINLSCLDLFLFDCTKNMALFLNKHYHFYQQLEISQQLNNFFPFKITTAFVWFCEQECPKFSSHLDTIWSPGTPSRSSTSMRTVKTWFATICQIFLMEPALDNSFRAKIQSSLGVTIGQEKFKFFKKSNLYLKAKSRKKRN